MCSHIQDKTQCFNFISVYTLFFNRIRQIITTFKKFKYTLLIFAYVSSILDGDYEYNFISYNKGYNKGIIFNILNYLEVHTISLCL